MAFFTLEDVKIGFNFFCVVYGIGTLGIPASFARAGPVYATIALLLMGLVNISSCVALSKVMLAAPKNVKTYIDVGEWVAGQPGRYAVLIAQWGVCLLVPCAFLVLGGTLLDGIAPDAFKPEVWSVIMAGALLPVVLTPTMKEGSVTALVGCLGTLFADGIAIYVVADKIGDHPPVISPDHNFKEITTMFGNLALAYSAAVMVPELQREHSQPARMPRVVACTMTFTACLFLIIGLTAYSYVGCQVPGNLLFAINGAALNLKASRGSVVLAYLSMQVHMAIAFAVILNPVLYLAERTILGMHKRPVIESSDDLEAAAAVSAEYYEKSLTPQGGVDSEKEGALTTSPSTTSVESDQREHEADEALRSEYRGAGRVLKYVVLRITIVALLLVCAILFKDHFLDITDFVGASAITLGGIILPIVFYIKVYWSTTPVWQKVVALVVILFCGATGSYVTYLSGKALFTNVAASPPFGFCPAKYQHVVYTNATYYGY
ncbi:hypothetical protein PINS_up011726 [Pythium insidiosum]|nr:hypothetical protein PINS_up011726 [Pythium insidiosum]